MMKLSEIRMVNTKVLKRNKANAKFFKIESRQYFDNLAADIKKRGILVPLVAKADGTLLAGHNRLTIAQLLKMKKVPVQYVKGKITAQAELEYIIKDNLLRRHLEYEERIALYRQIYKDFETRILLPGTLGVSSRKLAEATGLNPRTVNYDLSREKHLAKKKANEALALNLVNEREVKIFNKAAARMLNCAIIEKVATIEAFYGVVKNCIDRLETLLHKFPDPVKPGAPKLLRKEVKP